MTSRKIKTNDDFHCAWHQFKNEFENPIATETSKLTADASTAVAATTLVLMTKASGDMLKNTTINGDTVIADYTKANAAISSASRERSIRKTLNYIERNKVPHDHHFANYSIDRYRNYGYTVTTKMEGAHWGHIKIFLSCGASATIVDVYINTSPK